MIFIYFYQLLKIKIILLKISENINKKYKTFVNNNYKNK